MDKCIFQLASFFYVPLLVQFKNFFFTAGSTVVVLLLTARDVLVLQGNHPVRLVLHSPEQK